MAETFKSDEEYIFKTEFTEDYGLQFMPTGESIVRCKDCKHLMTYNDGTYDCKYLVERMFAEGELNNKPNDFCCWGERKEVEE